MNTVWTKNPFPKVGIRPIIDGRRGHFGHINADYFYFDVNKQ